MSNLIKRGPQERLEELKRLGSLLTISIGQQEKRIDQAKRGKLTFTQITSKTLFGLLRGDLRRLKEEKDQTIRDIAELEEEIRKSLADESTQELEESELAAGEKPADETIQQFSMRDQPEEDCFTSIVQEERETDFPENFGDNQPGSDKEEGSIHMGGGDEADQDAHNSVHFDVIETPDITEGDLLSTLKELDSIEEKEKYNSDLYTIS